MNLAGTRCVNCGAKMRFAKVVHFNSFRAPEAVDYDISIARQKLKKKVKKATHEVMCPCCGYRLPAKEAKSLFLQQPSVTKAQEKVTVKKAEPKKATKKKAKKKDNKKANNNANTKKSNVGAWIKLIIFLAVLGVCAYFAYTNREELLSVYNQIKDAVNGILDFARGLEK